MLSKGSIGSVITTAQNYAALNKALTPVPGTPLSHLYGNTFKFDIEEDLEAFASITATSSGGDINNPTTHDRVVNELVPFLSKMVNSHISFARNVVQPTVDEFLKLVNENYRPTVDASGEFNIVTQKVLEISKVDELKDALSYFKDKPYTTNIKPFTLVTNDPVSLLEEILLTADPELAEHYAHLLKENNELVVSTFKDFFITNYFENLELTPKNAIDVANRHLIGFLIANTLYDQAHPTVLSYDLYEYKEVVADIRNLCANYYLKAKDYVDQLVTSSTLVTSIDRKTITVIYPVYKEWLTQGNSQETLFGMMVSSVFYSSTALINQYKEKLDKAWFDYLNFSSTNIKLNNFNNLLDSFKYAYKKLFEVCVNESEKEAMAVKDYYQIADKLFEQELATVRMTDLEDMTLLAIRLIAKSRFYYTSSFEILDRIYTYLSKDEKLDPREAALIAQIEYVSRYLAKQITIN